VGVDAGTAGEEAGGGAVSVVAAGAADVVGAGAASPSVAVKDGPNRRVDLCFGWAQRQLGHDRPV